MSGVLLLCALAAIGTSLVLMATGGVAPAAIMHVALATGVLPLILTAMREFVPVLTRTGPAGNPVRQVPWLAMLGGLLAATTLAGALPIRAGIATAAGVALVASATVLGWSMRRARASLGTPHPCMDWYMGALILLVMALTAALTAATVAPHDYVQLRRLHLHLNTVGFIALTAVGTLQVLMPTVTGSTDSGTATRMRVDWRFALAGAIAIAVGAATWRWLALVGFVLWAEALVRLGLSWWRFHRRAIFSLHGAAPSLAAALLGLALSLGDGVLHATGFRSAGSSALFLCGFLLPLVTGAASHLLPVWLLPGNRAWHSSAQRILQRYGGLRALLFLVSGVLAWNGLAIGYSLACAGIVAMAIAAILAITRRPGRNVRME